MEQTIKQHDESHLKQKYLGKKGFIVFIAVNNYQSRSEKLKN